MISLSFSKLDLLSRCPQQYFRRYELHEPRVIGPQAILGRAFHKALEINFKHRLAHGVDLGQKEVTKVYRDEFMEESKKPNFIDLENLTEDQINWEGLDPKEMRDLGQKALVRYHTRHVPFLEPMLVEEKIERIIGDVRLVGILDLVTTTGVVIDYKTVAFPWITDKIESSLQPTVYAALLDTPINFDFHFITRNIKTGAVGMSVRRTTRTSSDIDWLLMEHIPQVLQLIDQELWIRNPGNQCWRCDHRRGCGYRV